MKRRLLGPLMAAVLLAGLMALPASASHLLGYTYTVSPDTAGSLTTSTASFSAGTLLPTSVTFHNASGELHAHDATVGGTPLTPAPTDGPGCEPWAPATPGCIDPDGAGPTPLLDSDAAVVGSPLTVPPTGLVAAGDFVTDGCGGADPDGPDTAAIPLFWNSPFVGALPPGTVAQLELPTSLVALYPNVVLSAGDAFQVGSHYDLIAFVPIAAIACAGSSLAVTTAVLGTSVPNPISGLGGGGLIQANPSTPGTYTNSVSYVDIFGGPHSETVSYTVTGAPPPPPVPDAGVDVIVNGPTRSGASGKTFVTKVVNAGTSTFTVCDTDVVKSVEVNSSPTTGTIVVLNPGCKTLGPGGGTRFRNRWTYGTGENVALNTVDYVGTLSSTFLTGIGDTNAANDADTETRTMT